MRAGDLFVQVQADYSLLADQLKEIEQAFSRTGKDAAKAMEESIRRSTMADNVEKELEEAIADAGEAGASAAAAAIEEKVGDAAEKIGQEGGNGIGRKMFGSLLKPTAFVGIAENLAEAINVANEKGIGAGLESLVNSIPVIGTAYRLGSAIGNAIGDAISDADEMEEAMLARMKATEARLIGAVAQESMRREEQSVITDQMISAARLERQLAIETARAAGDEREVAFLEAESRVADLKHQLELDLAKTESADAERLLRENFDRQVELEQMAVDLKYAELDQRDAEQVAKKEALEAAAAERIAAQEAREAERLAAQQEREAEKLADEERRAAEKLEKDLAKAAEDRIKEIAALEDERLAAQTAGITDANTALGSFRFDAYPAADKRKNDERIANAIEGLRRDQLVGAGGFA